MKNVGSVLLYGLTDKVGKKVKWLLKWAVIIQSTKALSNTRKDVIGITEIFRWK